METNSLFVYASLKKVTKNISDAYLNSPPIIKSWFRMNPKRCNYIAFLAYNGENMVQSVFE